MSKLFIAEKPSLATEIAKGLGTPEKKNGYFQIGDNVVTWAYGHILRQLNPEEYSEQFKTWRMEDLPIVPSDWRLAVADNCKVQYEIIKKLIGQADEIVNAGDPDREGQLLIDEILDSVGNIKPVKRILLNALDEKSVQSALKDMRANEDFIGLKNSALARSRADWLIGMNFSRAYTIAARQAGYSSVLKIGRVKTPTMALVVRREEDIKNFQPVVHYQVQINWEHENGIIKSRWQPKENVEGLNAENRLLNKSIAENLLQKIRTVAGYSDAMIQKIEESEKKEAQRLPYSLSALQIEAGEAFGFDPQLVLDTMQQLYEKKLTTYPRSDCDFLPENQFVGAPEILQNLKMIDPSWVQHVERANLSIRSRAWNDKKISAHHAIIPTAVKCDFDTLTAPQQVLYIMVAKAYLAQFFDTHIYHVTKINIVCSDEIFTATGKSIIQNGWKDLYPLSNVKKADDKNEECNLLPVVRQGENVKYQDGRTIEKITTPPKRFTTSTLLKAMKEIHNYVKNPDLKTQLKSVSGIGTEATRASIIDELLKGGFLAVEKKVLVPTETAYMLVKLLPDEITYPDTTAIWEDQFEQIVNQEISLTKFFEQQKNMVADLVNIAKTVRIAAPANSIKCPVCGHVLLKRNGKNGYFWSCSDYPNCKISFDDMNNKPVIYLCSKCGKGYLRKISGVKGAFWSCNAYPNCKTTYKNKKGKPDL